MSRVFPRLSAAILVLAAVLAPANSSAQGTSSSGQALIRVNQVGYAVGATKRAYLMSTASESGAEYQVKDSDGRIVYSAQVGASTGAWSSTYSFVYSLDFDRVSRIGTYELAVLGPFHVVSPTFAIDTAPELYSRLVHNTLSFYQNERDGKDFIRSGLRTAPGHLNDGHAMTYLPPTYDANDTLISALSPLGRTIDASGGWWDAGDYLKFVETHSYTVAVLLIGMRDFSEQMGPDSPNANFSNEVKFGLDWLQRMWDDQTLTLYYQVGIGAGNNVTASDHDIWRLPQVDDTYLGTDPLYTFIRNRPVFRAGPAGSLISPNLAGRLAADFALCYQFYRHVDPAYAKKCLLSGEHVFDLANTSPTGNLLTVAPFDFYPEVEWRDDLELGATELALALSSGDPPPGLPHSDSRFYLQRAAHWAHAYIAGPNDAVDTLNLYDVSALAHSDLFRLLGPGENTAGLEVTRSALIADLKKQLDGAVSKGVGDPFGFGFPWDTFDTTTHGAGLAVTAAIYSSLTHTSAYTAYGQRWLANILGANAWGTSLIVGAGKVFPFCMQHQVTNLVGSLNGSAPILAGAAVEGPNSFAATGVVAGMVTCPADGSDRFAQFNGTTAVFQDNVQSYSTVEPAIDLTATSPLAFSWQMVDQSERR
jgi:endoglucanase